MFRGICSAVVPNGIELDGAYCMENKHRLPPISLGRAVCAIVQGGPLTSLSFQKYYTGWEKKNGHPYNTKYGLVLIVFSKRYKKSP